MSIYASKSTFSLVIEPTLMYLVGEYEVPTSKDNKELHVVSSIAE